MKILIAEDEIISRALLEEMLSEWGHTALAVEDGEAALKVLSAENPPPVAILDWKMPRLEGIEVCRRVRKLPLNPAPYLILLTVNGDTPSIVAGLKAGANDHISKPFAPEELCARVNVGVQLAELQQKLANRVRELEEALAHVKQLQGILPICSYCKSVRDDKNYWQQVETYFARHSEVLFSHGICPDCLAKETRKINRMSPE